MGPGPDGPMGPPPGDIHFQLADQDLDGPMGPPPGDMGDQMDQWDLLQEIWDLDLMDQWDHLQVNGGPDPDGIFQVDIW